MEKVIFDGNLLDNDGGAVKDATYFRMTLEDDSLKLLFICVCRDIISKGKTYNDKLYEGDTVELFITLSNRNRYLELEVNPDGVQYAAIVENDGQSLNITYLDESPFESLTQRTDEGYRSSWDIPMSKLRTLGLNVNDAYFNVFRQDFEGEGLNLYALNPTMCATFHKTEKFIKLDL